MRALFDVGIFIYLFQRCRHQTAVHRYFQPQLRPHYLYTGIVQTIDIYCETSSELKLVLFIYIIGHDKSLNLMIIVEFNGAAGKP